MNGIPQDQDNNLSFLISAGLFDPIRCTIEDDSQVIFEKKGRPLLDHALRRGRVLQGDISRPNTKVVRLLLENGANSNQSYKGQTIWHTFLSYMRDNKKDVAKSPDLWIEATELMLEHGAEEFPTVGVFFREIFDHETAKRLNKMLLERNGVGTLAERERAEALRAESFVVPRIFSWMRSLLP